MRIIDLDKVKYHGLESCSEEYKKGYLDAVNAALDDTPTIIEDIKIMSPHPKKAITLFYNFDTTKLEDISNLVNYLGEKYPENAVIAIPDKISLENCSKDVLENIISMIAEIIESL
jgi:hypothetical protein